MASAGISSSHRLLCAAPPPCSSIKSHGRLPLPNRVIVLSHRLTSVPSLRLSLSPPERFFSSLRPKRLSIFVRSSAGNGPEEDRKDMNDAEGEDLGVRVALSMLKFYKREISPLMLSSCRYVPTCSEYSMGAYKKYGVVRGTILTAWRLCRCNPLGGTGFDPPRWFGEEEPHESP